jgi:hypothetical protein
LFNYYNIFGLWDSLHPRAKIRFLRGKLYYLLTT